MPKSIIGLDIGTHSIKVVEVRGGLKNLDIVSFAEFPSAEGVSHIFKEGAASRTMVVTAIPQASMRVVSLPFRDERKIEQVIPFELEQHIPFPLDEVTVSWHILGSGEVDRNTTDILAAAVQKSVLKEFLEGLSRGGVDPVIVDLDALVPSSLSPMTNIPDAPTALLDIGKSKSSFTVFSGKQMCYARILPSGGEDLTRAIERKTGLSRDEAESAKIQHGLEEGEKGKYAGIIRESLEGFALQISQTIHSVREYTGVSVEKLLIHGGGAKLKGLREFLSGKLSIEVGPLELTLSLPASLDTIVFGKAIGLAMRGAARAKGSSTINFRKGEFVYHSPREEISGKLKVAGALIGAGILLGLVSMGVSMVSKETGLKKLIQDEERIFASTFPDLPVPEDPLKEMQALVSRERAGGAGGSSYKVIDLLREMSSRAPKDIKVDIRELNIDMTKIRLLADTESLEAVDKIVSELRKAEIFSDINVLDTRRSTDGNSVNFQLSLSLKAK